MKFQSERDRVDKRIVETKLREMTKDRDQYKEKFLEQYEQINELENSLNDARYEYDELLRKFNFVVLDCEKMNMLMEDYRSMILRYDVKSKQLKVKEDNLKTLEKEVRSIKKRDNPYEYVDFDDKYCQTNNPTKERGINTDELVIGVATKPTKVVKSKMRSSFADTVTTVLGGIPAATETITDIEMITPKETYFQTRNRAPFQIKSRPHSSQLLGTTYSYNLRNGVIEEEHDPLQLVDTSTSKTGDMFRTTSSLRINNFNSPAALRPTALQRHQKAYKTHYGPDPEIGYTNNFEHRAKTALATNKERDYKIKHQTMKSVYVKQAEHSRPMTEQPGMRKHKSKILKRREESQKNTTGSRPVSQDPTMSKTGTHVSTNHRNYVNKCKSSLRNLIKAASTRNEQ